MATIWLIIKHEVRVTLAKKSFWLFTFLMPLILIGTNLANIFAEAQPAISGAAEEGLPVDEAPSDPLIGLVDSAGLLPLRPSHLPDNLFISFADESAGLVALEAGALDQLVVVAPDYIDTGQVTVYAADFQVLMGGPALGVVFGGPYEGSLEYLLTLNLLGDARQADAVINPTPADRARIHPVRPPENPPPDAETAVIGYAVASAIPYIFYFILIVVSGYILQSVAAEKENRVVEILLLSVRPRWLMMGKLLGLSLVALLQLVVWVGGGMIFLDNSPAFLNLSNFDFPPGFFIWAALFLLCGYFVYAAIMATAGALAPNAREGGQMTWLMILPLLPTLMFASTFFEEPHGGLALGLSLFPLSAPSAMVARIAVAEVPLWQIFLSLGGLMLTSYGFVTLAARFFRPQNLLSTAGFNWKRVWTDWRD